MKFLVLLNEGALALGGLNPKLAGDRLSRAFADAGAAAEIRCVAAPALAAAAKEAMESDVDAIIAGGGGGTLNLVANAIAAGHKALGALPLGRHNHFAREMKIPMELEAAAATLARGAIVDFPVAEVNGRLFLAFAGAGLSAYAAAESWPTMAIATVRRLIGRPAQHVKVRARGHTIASDTPMVILSNNADQIAAFGLTPSPAPERGLLNVYIARARPRKRNPLAMVGTMLRAASGTLNLQKPSFNVMAMPDVRLDSSRRRIAVTIDGETWNLAPPLHCTMRERPMRLLIPAAEAPEIELTPTATSTLA